MDKASTEIFNNCLKAIQTGINLVLNLFFPPRCSFCSNIMDWSSRNEEVVCPDCLVQTSFVDTQSCIHCGKSLEKQSSCSCGLDSQKLYYDKVYSACEYEGITREGLLDFKFSGRKELARVFAWFIIKKLQMTNEKTFDIIISVPIHKTSFKERRYNQSELIAEHIAKYYSKQLVKNNLIKTKETLMQSKLNKNDRSQNIKDAFEVVLKDEVKGKNILLIDDILTTGATVNECSKVLKQNGAKQIIVATVATGKVLNN
ncbi:MAG: ComF family protein [Deltaproteobacteria bacterium]